MDEVTDTTEEVKELEREIRWYHFAAAIAVIILAGVAIVTALNHFDVSLVNSAATLKLSVFQCGTNTEDIQSGASADSEKYLGVNDGELYAIDGDRGKVKRVKNEDEANLRIDKVDSQIKFSIKINDEWKEYRKNWGSTNYFDLSDEKQCGVTTGLNFSL
jgi:hypothetical protein